ncbi:hypothetical protein B0H14DRAFT_3152969 [Mycena olivaceomarginata]|nr:hypothetical protein B0H14DRAFT_3152969 [Mycena olivaceomarginata]
MPASVKRSSASVPRTSGCQAEVLGEEGGEVGKGDDGKSGKGEGGKGEVVAGRERESDVEVVEIPGEQRREKKGMGREDVKEKDMKANANAKWNGRQGQSRAK